MTVYSAMAGQFSGIYGNSVLSYTTGGNAAAGVWGSNTTVTYQGLTFYANGGSYGTPVFYANINPNLKAGGTADGPGAIVVFGGYGSENGGGGAITGGNLANNLAGTQGGIFANDFCGLQSAFSALNINYITRKGNIANAGSGGSYINVASLRIGQMGGGGGSFDNAGGTGGNSWVIIRTVTNNVNSHVIFSNTSGSYTIPYGTTEVHIWACGGGGGGAPFASATGYGGVAGGLLYRPFPRNL